MSQRGLTIIELMAVVVILSVLISILMPNMIARQARNAKEAAVRANAHTVQLAAEDFAALNRGHYAASAGQFRHSLPDSNGLLNPFSGAKELPADGAADDRGEIGYASGASERYSITGYGHDSIVIDISNGH